MESAGFYSQRAGQKASGSEELPLARPETGRFSGRWVPRRRGAQSPRRVPARMAERPWNSGKKWARLGGSENGPRAHFLVPRTVFWPRIRGPFFGPISAPPGAKKRGPMGPDFGGAGAPSGHHFRLQGLAPPLRCHSSAGGRSATAVIIRVPPSARPLSMTQGRWGFAPRRRRSAAILSAGHTTQGSTHVVAIRLTFVAGALFQEVATGVADVMWLCRERRSSRRLRCRAAA